MIHLKTYGVLLIQIAWCLQSLDINQSLDITQNILLNVLEFNTANIEEKYISITLTLSDFDYSKIPLLTLSVNNQPTLSNSSLISDITDYYAYNNQLSQHTIILDSQAIAGSTAVYIGILYENYNDSSITYNLKSQQSSNFMCPNKCSGISHGTCIALNNCDCQTSYIGRDCGNANVWDNLNKNKNVSILGLQRKYFEINNQQCNWYLGGKTSAILKCSWTGNEGMIYIGNPTSSEVDLPNRNNYMAKFNLSDAKSSLEKKIDFSDKSKQIVFIAVYSTQENQKITISCQLYEDSSSSSSSSISKPIIVLICIVCISGSLLIMLAIGCVLRYRYLKSMNSRISEIESPSKIPANSINTWYPITSLKDFPDMELPLMCMICMEDYSPESKVRKLNCGHIFHAACIDEWFKHNTICCLCKRVCDTSFDASPGDCSPIRDENTRIFNESINGLTIVEIPP